MANFSLGEKLKIVLDTIISTPLFSITALVGIVLIVLMIICIVKKKHIPKWLFITGWLFVIVFIVLRYTRLVPTLLDNLVDTVFKGLYFPTFGLYITILLLSNIIFVIMNFTKNIRRSYKIISLINAITLNVLFIFIAGIITKNKIEISTDFNLYTNSTLLVLLQISMGIFLSFILVLFFIRVYVKMKLLDAVKFDGDYKYPDMGSYVTDNVYFKKNEIFVRKVIKPIRKKGNDIKVHKIIKK